ncbi:hydroxyacid dehydrogenase [Candidatus Bathyarchaeota archaeon]|nr:hydroxyacid dehydrogenase [Candidatus Bathyarchaeota archaeon]
MKIVIPDDYPPVISGTKYLEELKKLGDVSVYNTRPGSEDELVERIKDAEVVVNIRAYCKFPEKVLRKTESLKLISILGAGTDNVDLEAASNLGIAVTNTPGAATEAVAEHALTLMLAVARRIPQIDRSVKEGKWIRGFVTQLYGKTLGVVGTGAIGSHLAKLGKGIGMKVIAWTFHPSPEKEKALGIKYVPLDYLLKESDVVSIHLRLTEDTRGLIGKREFSLMKKTAILINTARAGIVDKEALIEALKNGRIAGAGLDVFHEEPIDPNDPILKLDNVVLTPHSAGQTREALEKGLSMVVENVRNYLLGKPTNLVNKPMR